MRLLLMEVVRTDDGVRRERHGVESSRVPRMATAEALRRQPATLEDAETQHRLEGVVRTGGIEAAARPQERADGPLVNADQECDEGAHRAATSFHSASRLACSTFPGVPLARGRALTTRSTAGISSWCRRNDSRMRRRMRLRATPPPATRTATASPRRGAESVLLFTVTLKNPSPRRQPWAYVASKSRLRRRRRCAGRVSRPGIVPSDLMKILGSPDCAASLKRACDLTDARVSAYAGPWRGAARGPCGRSWWPCAHGTRGCAYGALCSADRYASYRKAPSIDSSRQKRAARLSR